MAPDFLAIGRVVADRTADRPRAGGAAAYAALTAAKLGLRAAIVTSPHTALDVREVLSGIEVCLAGLPASTTFENVTTPSGRVQYWYGHGPLIHPKDVPESWRKAPIVHLAPVAQEITPAIALLFPESLLGITPQGWFRRRDASGRVYPGPWRGAQQALQRANVVVVSPEDYGAGRTGVERYLTKAPVLVITHGAAGARLWSNGRWRQVPAFLAEEVDATGAGDVFAAALLCRYAQERDPWQAACFASCAASLSVEGSGFSALPSRAQVLERINSPATVP